MKNIKILLLSIISVLLLIWTNLANAITTSTSNDYNEPIITNDFNFEATLSDNWSVEMYWNEYNKEEKLKYYKLVRSSKNSNPVYPDDWYIKYSTDYNFTKYTDYWAPEGYNYYRICAITYENNRYCSDVVKIYKEKKTNTTICTMEYNPVCWDINWIKKTYSNKCMLLNANAKYLYYWKCSEETTSSKTKDYVNKTSLSYSMKNRLNTLVKNFIEKVENKYSTTEERIKILEKVMDKFASLAKEKPKLEDMIDYINNKIKIQLEEYDDWFSEIEDILNDF